MKIEKIKQRVRGIEERYKKIAGLDDTNLDIFPLKRNKNTQVKTDIQKSKQFGEVFTPLWLADFMINQLKIKSQDIRTLDLCAGYGQFSVRLLRYYVNKFGEDFDLDKFLKNHYCSELQLASCYNLLYVFGRNLNLFIGDATKLNKLPEDASGIWCYIEIADKWVCLTETIKNIFMPKPRKPISQEDFINTVNNMVDGISEEYRNIMNYYSDIKNSSKKYKEKIFGDILNHDKVKNTLSQKHCTPFTTVSDMCNLIDDIECKTILVMFNWEFLQHLINDKKLNPSNITFAGELEVLNKVLAKLYGVNYITINTKDIIKLKKQFVNKNFDVCLSNPPYNDHLHLKILMAMEKVADEFIIVHPSNWLIDRKGSSHLFVKFKDSISGKVKSLKLFNGNPIFKIGLFFPCVISHYFVGSKFDKIKVNYLGDTFEVDDINNITKYGSKWFDIVEPFISNIKKECTKDNVWNHELGHQKLLPVQGKEYCQIAAIRGNVHDSSMHDDDHYTLVMKKSDNNKGIRKAMDKRPGPTYQFDTTQERDNFIDYLKTDFARFCLSYFKIGQNVFYGEMALIPWLDFTQSWDDEKLFKHFNIDKKTQDYIREFIPDYYGIRNKQDSKQDSEAINAA